MSLDRRMRDGLARITSGIEPDLDPHLRAVVRTGRRRIAFRRATVALIAMAAVAGGIFVGPRAFDAVENFEQRPAGQPTTGPPTTAIGAQAIAGTYTRAVPTNGPEVRRNHLEGTWTIELRPDGSMAVTGPPSFTGVVSGAQFQVQGDTFRTTLFIQDVCSNLPVPTYRWTRVGNRLTFTPVDDRCRGRVAVLSSGPWVSGG
jgi:hypothetical protein